MEFLDWLDDNFPRDFFDETIAQQALRHLRIPEKTELFAEDYVLQRTAEGRWYEFLVYEILLALSLRTDTLKAVVRKGADAQGPHIRPHSDQNGFYYSEKGNLTVRGNGQTIAEMDLFFVDHHGDLGFFEVITSAMGLKEFHDEISYKKMLLGSMLGQRRVPFVLVSSADVSRYSSIQQIAAEPDNLVLITDPIEEIRDLIYEGSIRKRPGKPAPHPKFLDLAGIRPGHAFDYRAIHDHNREQVVRAMLSGGDGGMDALSAVVNPLSKKIMLGTLDDAGVEAMLHDRAVRVKDAVYDADDVNREFRRVVIAFDIPAYTPVIYLKVKGKEEYLKIVQNNSGDLVYQSKRTPTRSMEGFYEWLNEEKPLVSATVAESYASLFLDMN
ncbi:hypothetical protein E2N92_00790 [Methanofollis formosanus]|uniref:Uncharacterized protein n=1 Tax=Methanofollis formosanus TaxID=299308 RepID=A0A8G0ZXY6_9EURY|nr:hypothetical protein [Methanofollis formosanus]QYZ78067.1 hypothetical protein E2N92_00790 [Methanofollis formosanus]